MIVDNTVTYHSRQPFAGPRKVFAAIAQGTKPVTATQTSLVLKSGDQMPSVGFGCWKISKDVCADAVYNAIKQGYRLLDSACDYGNEVEVGQGLKRAIDEGIVKREDMFITSKLWNTYHRKEHVRDACVKTMKDLGVDYLDLYLIHFPIALKFVPFDKTYPPEWMTTDEKHTKPTMIEDVGVSYQETYQAMEKLHEEGLVRNIGGCNITVSMIREILCYAKVRPAVLQVELHPRLVQSKLLRYCRENSIAVTGFSSFASASYVELGMAKVEESLLDNQDIIAIGKAHNKSAAQVLLRWAVQRGTAIIPKSMKVERMGENIALFDFNLSEKEMEQLNAFD